MTVEDMLEEAAWRDRNGLDDLGWNPDVVAPPRGDVYQREARDHRLLGIIASGAVFFALVGLIACAMWGL